MTTPSIDRSTQSICASDVDERLILPNHDWMQRYQRIRAFSEALAAPLTPEDCAVQSMPDASPTKWHLAHTTWFFETFLLKNRKGYRPYDSAFERLFNSYYNSVGEPFPRHCRGQISRPGLAETRNYRKAVDDAVSDLIASNKLSSQDLMVLELGLNHEQQHQELILTDIKHAFSRNPGLPAYQSPNKSRSATLSDMHLIEFEEAVIKVGSDGEGFVYDNETPRHKTYVNRYKIASRCVTNGEYVQFINDRGYSRPELWLSLGWAKAMECRWQSPEYWMMSDGQWKCVTLAGLSELQLDEPVTHISYFEADAFARWAGKRLPTEFEWENAACQSPRSSVFADKLFENDLPFHPQIQGSCKMAMRIDENALDDAFGNVWEWTGSQYMPYPGFKLASGALGEYNGKFMCNQFVLRGGSCATSSDHMRLTYRNFFPPDARWQFSGIRLACDA